MRTHPTWNDICVGTAVIANRTMQRSLQIDVVVGITRGGLVPAVVFSHVFEIPMYPVNYSAKDGRGDNKNHDNILPFIGTPIPSGEGTVPSVPSLLVLDDICDSGRTLEDVAHFYRKQGHEVFTAALYYKEGASVQPDVWWQKIPEDAPWVIFPWEI